MKHKRIRWLGTVLASTMAVTSLPVTALAAEPVEIVPAEVAVEPAEVVPVEAEAESVEIVPEETVAEPEEIISTDASYSGLEVKSVTAKPVMIGADVLAQGNLVYLGTKSENYTWTDAHPRWIVLDPKTANNGTSGYAFLLSYELIGEKEGGEYGNVFFDQDNKPNAGQTKQNEWQGSDAQAWCRTFLGNVFSAGEQAAILKTNKTDAEYEVKVYEEGSLLGSFKYGESSLKNDQIFFLSGQEALTPAYGFTDKNDVNGNSALVANYKEKSSAGYWWLRSPHIR